MKTHFIKLPTHRSCAAVASRGSSERLHGLFVISQLLLPLEPLELTGTLAQKKFITYLGALVGSYDCATSCSVPPILQTK